MSLEIPDISNKNYMPAPLEVQMERVREFFPNEYREARLITFNTELLHGINYAKHSSPEYVDGFYLYFPWRMLASTYHMAVNVLIDTMKRSKKWTDISNELDHTMVGSFFESDDKAEIIRKFLQGKPFDMNFIEAKLSPYPARELKGLKQPGEFRWGVYETLLMIFLNYEQFQNVSIQIDAAGDICNPIKGIFMDRSDRPCIILSSDNFIQVSYRPGNNDDPQFNVAKGFVREG